MGIIKFLMGLLKSTKTPLTDKTLIKKFLKDNPGTKPDLSGMDLPVGLQKVITKNLNKVSSKQIKGKPNIDQIAKDFTNKQSTSKNILAILKDKKKRNGTSLVISKNKNVANPDKKIVIDGDPIKKIKKVDGPAVSVKSGTKSLLKKKTPTMTTKNNKTFTSTVKNVARKALNHKKKLAAIAAGATVFSTLPSTTVADGTLKNKNNKNNKDDKKPIIKKPNIPKVIIKTLPKLKSNDYTGRFIDKKGDVAYDSASDFLAHMFGTPKKRAMPKKTARIIGTGNKLKRKDADTKGAGKGVKFTTKRTGGSLSSDKYVAKQIRGWGKARKPKG